MERSGNRCRFCDGLLVQNSTVETAVRRYGSKDVRWSSQGMLRLTPEAMQRLFKPTTDQIKEAIANVIDQPAVRGTRPSVLILA